MPNRNLIASGLAVILAVAVLLFPHSVFAATFGVTANNGNTQTFSADRMYLSTATPASSGTVTAGACRNWVSATGSYPSKIVIYSDSAGAPSSLLAESDEVTISATTEAENAYTFSGANQISIVSGTPYWFGLFFDDPGTPSAVISRANNASVVHFQSTAYPTPPSSFTSGGTANGPHDCYITYTESGGGGAASAALYQKNAATYVRNGAFYQRN